MEKEYHRGINEPPVNLYSYKYVSFLPGAKPHKMNFALTERSYQKGCFTLTLQSVATFYPRFFDSFS